MSVNGPMTKNMYHIVPWCSKEEWAEVYYKVYCTDMQQWKQAYNQMCAWKARVHKLPMGIDLTLLLLSARITELNNKIDYAERGTIVSSAIARFVSMVVKIPQRNIHAAMPMHVMAEEIGLPKYLVDLRHEIVHAADSPIQSSTLHIALNAAWDWLKEFYWVREEKKFLTENELIIEPTQENVEESGEFNNLLEPFLDDLDALVRRLYPDVPQEITEIGSTELGQRIGGSVSRYYSVNPHNCLKAIINNLLVVKEPPIIRAAAVAKHSCSCGCTLMIRVVQGVRWIIIALHNLGALPRLLQHLMEEITTETNKCHDLANEWFCIVLSCLTSPETLGWTKCSGHNIKLRREQKFDWRWLVQMMLNKEKHNTIQLAFRIMQNRKEFSKEEIEELRYLVAIQFGDVSGVTDNVSVDKYNDDKDTIYGIEHIVDKAKEISYKEGKVAEIHRDVIFGNLSQGLYHDNTQMRQPLGILPGQKYDPNIYKKLLLDYSPCSQNKDI